MSASLLTLRPARPAADHRGALAVTRRADWRFLLPDPALGRVAYLAPHDPELVAALSALGAELELLDAPRAAKRHDLVAITRGRPRTARAAHGLLRRGGWLYAEVPGWSVPAWMRALAASGFEEVGAHWLWPDARSCREIVPLEREPLRHALGRRDPGGRLRLRARAAQLLAASGIFTLAVRRAAVIGRRS